MSAALDRSSSYRSASAQPRRRVYLLVCLYRIACGILLLSVVYATDTRTAPLLQGNWLPPLQGGLLLTICLAYLGFGFFCVAAADRMNRAPGGWLLVVLIGDLLFLVPVLLKLRGIDLANLEQVNQLIIRDMDDGVLVVDEAGIVRNRNAQADRLLDRDDFPAGNSRLHEFAPRVGDVWQEWFSRNGLANVTVQLMEPTRTLSVRFASVSPQRRGGCLIYLQDMSRAQSHAQQIKLAALGRLTASIAHEVRNPLSAINHATELLKENEDTRSDSDRRLLQIIHGNTQRISRLLQEVMQLNRRDTRQASQINLASWIQNLLNDITTAEQVSPSVIITKIPPHLAIWYDQGHLGQIVWNLVKNALHYCQQRDGSIQLIARRGHVSGTVILDISDDGRGIPSEVRAQIFEPFFTTRTGGTGLGLYLARELSEANGGRLELLESGTGARFQLTMPSATT